MLLTFALLLETVTLTVNLGIPGRRTVIPVSALQIARQSVQKSPVSILVFQIQVRFFWLGNEYQFLKSVQGCLNRNFQGKSHFCFNKGTLNVCNSIVGTGSKVKTCLNYCIAKSGIVLILRSYSTRSIVVGKDVGTIFFLIPFQQIQLQFFLRSTRSSM